MLPEDRIRIGHMMEAAERALAFVAGRTRDDMGNDAMLPLALARAIEILGEAAAHVSAETREVSPAVPWRQIIGMRNRLVHAYLDVDTEILWTTVTERLPELVRELRALLATENC